MGMIEDLVAYVDAQTAWTTGHNLFGVFLPDDPQTAPDDAVVVYEYEGRQPDETFGSFGIDRPRLQLVTRSKSYATARSNHESVRSLLRALSNEDIGSHRYLRVQALGGVFVLERDSQERWKLVSNYQVWIQ